MSDNKIAVLSMDIEDWYHLEYFNGLDCDKTYSLLDGVDNYLEILEKHNVPSSFFVLGEIAESIKSTLNKIRDNNHDIGSHGWDHKRPITMSKKDFKASLIRSKNTIESIISAPVEGYRASCFSLNRELLNQVQKAGFSFDSSRINFSSHPLYETINMDGYHQISPNIFKQNNFFEFEVSTYSCFNKRIPVSGGGYLRILPWLLSKILIQAYLNQKELYTLYIHPFELSLKHSPLFSPGTKFHNQIRFKTGRRTVHKKLSNLIILLKENGYRFTTFTSLKKELQSNHSELYNTNE